MIRRCLVTVVRLLTCYIWSTGSVSQRNPWGSSGAAFPSDSRTTRRTLPLEARKEIARAKPGFLGPCYGARLGVLALCKNPWGSPTSGARLKHKPAVVSSAQIHITISDPKAIILGLNSTIRIAGHGPFTISLVNIRFLGSSTSINLATTFRLAAQLGGKI
ncbi:hypothetical protein M432DRAFT_312652 [Thermoascus aurantiacus ATCC 26904]